MKQKITSIPRLLAMVMVIVLSLSVFAIPASAANSPALLEEGYYNIVNANGYYLNVYGQSGWESTSGVNICLYARDGSNEQIAVLQKIAPGVYNIGFKTSDLVVDISRGNSWSDSVNAGDNVDFYRACDPEAQDIEFIYVGNGYYKMRLASNTSLVIAGTGAYNNANVRLEEDTGASDQLWKLVPLQGQSLPSTTSSTSTSSTSTSSTSTSSTSTSSTSTSSTSTSSNTSELIALAEMMRPMWVSAANSTATQEVVSLLTQIQSSRVAFDKVSATGFDFIAALAQNNAKGWVNFGTSVVADPTAFLSGMTIGLYCDIGSQMEVATAELKSFNTPITTEYQARAFADALAEYYALKQCINQIITPQLADIAEAGTISNLTYVAKTMAKNAAASALSLAEIKTFSVLYEGVVTVADLAELSAALGIDGALSDGREDIYAIFGSLL